MARTVKAKKAPPAPPASPPEETGLSMLDLGITDGVEDQPVPTLDAMPAALFMVHPERWAVIHGMVVPLCGRLPIIGGVGNVKVVNKKKGTLSIANAVSIKKRRGWKIIPLRVDGESYLYEATPGVFLTRWDTAYAGSSAITNDSKGFAEWLRGLVESGFIPRPKPYVLERLRAEKVQLMLQFQDQVRTVPSKQVDLDRVVAELKAIEAEIGGTPLVPIQAKPAGLGANVVDADAAPDGQE